MISSAGVCSVALLNPRPAGAESTLTGNVASPFQAEPAQVGTWADTFWAIRFYEKFGFQIVGPQGEEPAAQKVFGLRPNAKLNTSVVMADSEWCEIQR